LAELNKYVTVSIILPFSFSIKFLITKLYHC